MPKKNQNGHYINCITCVFGTRHLGRSTDASTHTSASLSILKSPKMSHLQNKRDDTENLLKRCLPAAQPKWKTDLGEGRRKCFSCWSLCSSCDVRCFDGFGFNMMHSYGYIDSLILATYWNATRIGLWFAISPPLYAFIFIVENSFVNFLGDFVGFCVRYHPKIAPKTICSITWAHYHMSVACCIHNLDWKSHGTSGWWCWSSTGMREMPIVLVRGVLICMHVCFWMCSHECQHEWMPAWMNASMNECQHGPALSFVVDISFICDIFSFDHIQFDLLWYSSMSVRSYVNCGSLYQLKCMATQSREWTHHIFMHIYFEYMYNFLCIFLTCIPPTLCALRVFVQYTSCALSDSLQRTRESAKSRLDFWG